MAVNKAQKTPPPPARQCADESTSLSFVDLLEIEDDEDDEDDEVGSHSRRPSLDQDKHY